LGNLGSSLVYLAIFTLYILTYGSFRIFGMLSEFVYNLSLKMQKVLTWNMIFLLSHSQFTAIMIPCLINLNSFTVSSNIIFIVSQMLSVMLVIVKIFILWKMFTTVKSFKVSEEKETLRDEFIV
jgi:hypothetical protein